MDRTACRIHLPGHKYSKGGFRLQDFGFVVSFRSHGQVLWWSTDVCTPSFPKQLGDSFDDIVFSMPDRGKTSASAMPARNPPGISLPKSWNKQVRSGLLHVIALARYAILYTRQGLIRTAQLFAPDVPRPVLAGKKRNPRRIAGRALPAKNHLRLEINSFDRRFRGSGQGQPPANANRHSDERNTP